MRPNPEHLLCREPHGHGPPDNNNRVMPVNDNDDNIWGHLTAAICGQLQWATQLGPHPLHPWVLGCGEDPEDNGDDETDDIDDTEDTDGNQDTDDDDTEGMEDTEDTEGYEDCDQDQEESGK